jgi:hypothetical protein
VRGWGAGLESQRSWGRVSCGDDDARPYVSKGNAKNYVRGFRWDEGARNVDCPTQRAVGIITDWSGDTARLHLASGAHSCTLQGMTLVPGVHMDVGKCEECLRQECRQRDHKKPLMSPEALHGSLFLCYIVSLARYRASTPQRRGHRFQPLGVAHLLRLAWRYRLA